MSMDEKEIMSRLVEIERLQNEIVEELHKIKVVLDLVVKSDTLSNKALIMLIDKVEKIDGRVGVFNKKIDDVMVV